MTHSHIAYFFFVQWIKVDDVMLLSFLIFKSNVGILNTYTMKAYIPKVLSDLNLFTDQVFHC